MIDLRTDVLTPPTDEMWEAMRRAEIGWTLYRQDRAVNELEERGAALFGKEAGLFVPTCGMANLLGLMTLGERGTQAILESSAHIATSEEWGIASVAGLFPQVVDGVRGVMTPESVAAAMQNLPPMAMNPYRTSLVCLENSHNNAGGVALSVEETNTLAAVAHAHGAQLYLDGARVWNSAAALGVPVKHLTQNVDAVGVSLNKGLCAPFGALLCGTRAMVEAARVNLRRIGGASIHKAGIFAAAGLVALNTMMARLPEDNARARRLAERLAGTLDIDLATVQTNIVFADVGRLNLSGSEFAARLERQGVLVYPRPGTRMRFVTHRMIGDAEIDKAIHVVKEVAGNNVETHGLQGLDARETAPKPAIPFASLHEDN